jgi:ABC-type cobalamin/Fe3+-siderophores transport system ATPase subunit
MDQIRIDNITYTYPETLDPVFENLSITLPPGITSLAGQNGTGKSTLLLLAGGILLPQTGSVCVHNIDTRDIRDETIRQRYVSFVYQNMEFETEETIEPLLHYVYDHGYCENKNDNFITTLITVFELTPVLGKKTQDISKGELQRVILAFSLLYGSKIIMMDEPVFAMEQHQKIKALEFFHDYAKKEKVSMYYSVHELELTEKYSDYMLLFDKKRNIRLGPTDEIFTKENLEQAYQIPYSMLKTKEALYRSLLEKGTYPGQT